MAKRRPRRRPIISKRRVEEFRHAFTGGEIDSLVAVYRRAAAEALRILSDASEVLGSWRRAQALLKQYHEVLAELQDESAAWISSNLPAAYQAGVEFGDEGVKGIRRAGLNLGKPQSAVFAQVHREAVAAVVKEMQRVTDHALSQIGRRVDDAFRKVGIQEVARGIAEGKTRLQVSREIKGRLLAEGRLKFTDRLGHDWDLDRYTEMVARTTTRQAMTTGTINRLREHNIELAQVSAHNAADFCVYYENVVVYIGPEPNPTSYPPLSAINGGSPFHPNCAHVMTPFVISLATPEERSAGKIEAELLNQSPGKLQRRFTKQFPERAREEGIRVKKTSRPAAKGTSATPMASSKPSPAAVQRTLAREERAIRAQARETAVIVSQSGEVILRKHGGSRSVSFTPSEGHLFQGNVLTHNHPSGNSFSMYDVRVACVGRMQEIRAVSTRYRYSIRPPAQGWDRVFWEDVVAKSHDRHEQELLPTLMARVSRGELTPAAASEIHQHELWQRVARDTGLRYNRTRWRK